MSKRGKPSKEKIKRRNIIYSLKTKINNESWRDTIWAETVCMTSHIELRDFGYETWGIDFSCSYIPCVDNGYILSDSRGRGVFQ